MTPPGGAWNEAGQSEDPAVELLERLGYTYATPEALEAERESSRDAVLVGRLEGALKTLNPWLGDDEVVRVSVCRMLGLEGVRVDVEDSAAGALARLSGGEYSLLISDVLLPDMDVIELLETVRARGFSTPVLIVTGQPTFRTAVKALQLAPQSSKKAASA